MALGRYVIDNPEPPTAMQSLGGSINALGNVYVQKKVSDLKRKQELEDAIALINAKTEAEMESPLGKLDIETKLTTLDKNREELGLPRLGEKPALGNMQINREPASLNTQDVPNTQNISLPLSSPALALDNQSFRIKELDKYGRPTGYEINKPTEAQQKRNVENVELSGQTKNIMELFNAARQESKGSFENVGKEGITGRIANIGAIAKAKFGYLPTVNVFQDRIKAFATITAKQAGEQRPTDADIERFIGAMMNFRNNDKENALQIGQQLKDLQSRGLNVDWAKPIMEQFESITGVSINAGKAVKQEEKPIFGGQNNLENTISSQETSDNSTQSVFGNSINQQSFSPENVPFLPNIGKTENMISKRPSAIQELVKDPSTFGRFKKHPLGTSLRTMAGAGELVEGTIANVGLAAQRGSAEGLGRQMSDTFSGKRPAQFGDIVRTTGFGGDLNEPLARTTGLLASSVSALKVLDIPTKGKLINSVNKAGSFLKSKLPTFMNKDYMIKRANLASDGMDELYEGLSKEYDTIYDKIGKNQLNRVQQDYLESILSELPENVISKISKSKLITKTKNGELVPDLNNLKAIKNVIKSAVPEKIWRGKAIGDMNTAALEQSYGKISHMMSEGNDELINLNKRYGEFRNMQKEINSVIYDQFGNIKTKALEQLFSKSGERGKQVFFEKFAQQWPKATQIIKDTQKYNSRQTAKKIVGAGAGIVGATMVGTAVAKPLIRKFGGGG